MKVVVNGEEVAPGKKIKLYKLKLKKEIKEIIRKKKEELDKQED